VKKLIAAFAVLALSAGVPAAVANKGHSKRAKVYKATILPVVYGADQAYSGIGGKAHLVDGRRRDHVTIHMRGLTPKTTYPWHVHVIADAPAGTNPCKANAPQGPIATAFKYRKLKSNKSGRANSKGSSRSFTVDRRTDLAYVDVHDPATGAPIACGVLSKPKAWKHKTKGGKGGSDKKGTQHGRDDRGKHKGQGPDHD
jgi:hypothetical protein